MTPLSDCRLYLIIVVLLSIVIWVGIYRLVEWLAWG